MFLLLLLSLSLSLSPSPWGVGAVVGQESGQGGCFSSPGRPGGTLGALPTFLVLLPRAANLVVPRPMGAPGAIPAGSAENASVHFCSTSLPLSKHFLFKRGRPPWGPEDCCALRLGFSQHQGKRRPLSEVQESRGVLTFHGGRGLCLPQDP